MLIKKISLSNIRSYIQESIDFPEGSTLLSGDIGSGKSSILLALEFCLFGLKKGYSSGSILRHGAKEGRIEVTLEIEGKEFIINRCLKRGSNGIKQDSGFIIANGFKTELSPVELKARVFDALGYPSEMLKKGEDLIYRYTVYTPQEEMKSILFEKPDIRLETIRKIFGIDKYRRIRDNSSFLLKDLRERIKAHEARAEGINEKKKEAIELQNSTSSLLPVLKTLEKKAEEQKKGIEAKKSEMSINESKIREKESSKNKLNVAKAKISEKKSLLARYEQEIKMLELKITELQPKLKDYSGEDPDSFDKKAAELEKEAQKTDYSIINKDKEILFCKQKTKEYIEEIEKIKLELMDFETLKSSIELLNKELSLKNQLKDEIENMQKLLASLQAEKMHVEKKIKEIEKLTANISHLENCPVCMQEVKENHKHKIISDYEEKKKEDHISLEAKNKDILSKSAKYEELKRKMQEALENERKLIIAKEKALALEKRKESLVNLSLKASEHESEIKKLEEEKNLMLSIDTKKITLDAAALRQKARKAREAKNTHERIIESEKRKNENKKLSEDVRQNINELEKETNLLSSTINSLEGIEEAFIQLKASLQDYERILKETEIKKAELSISISSNEKQLGRISSEIQEKEKSIKKAGNMARTSDWIKSEFIPLMQNIEKHVMSKVYVEFSELFEGWFSILVDDDTIYAKLDEEFSPIIEQNGYETEISSLSGGEKTSLALAYRLALNKTVNDVIGTIKTKDLIILDEPTDGFSSEQLNKVRDVLKELNMKQAIIVSHEPKIEGFVDNIIRIRKEGHTSIVNS